MKKLFIILTLSMIVLLGSCYNQKNKTLESKILQLQHQIDSLKQVIDSANSVAIKSAMEAMRQKEWAEAYYKKAMEDKLAKGKAQKQAKSVQK